LKEYKSILAFNYLLIVSSRHQEDTEEEEEFPELREGRMRGSKG